MRLTVTILFLSCFYFASAQSPYELDWKKESIYLGVGAAFYASAGIVEKQSVRPLTELEILSLNRDHINWFDRQATFNFSYQASSSNRVGAFGIGEQYVLLEEFSNIGANREVKILTRSSGAELRNRYFLNDIVG